VLSDVVIGGVALLLIPPHRVVRILPAVLLFAVVLGVFVSLTVGDGGGDSDHRRERTSIYRRPRPDRRSPSHVL